MDRTLTIQRSKTAAGERLIPLNLDAFSAVLRLRERAKAMFGDSVSPDWYLFPHAEGASRPDPSRPMSGWRSAWRKITKAIYCPACATLQDPAAICSKEECKADISKLKSTTAGLRFHDLRHHAITELAESWASDQTIMSIAGHVSQRMLAHYSHVRLEAKRNALDALARPPLNAARPRQSHSGFSRGANEGYDTNYDTKQAETPGSVLQTIEKNGGDDGTRTRGLCRDRAAF